MKQYASGFLVVRSMSWPINQLILLVLHTLTNLAPGSGHTVS